MTKEQLKAVEDLALAFANKPVDWELEDSQLQVRISGSRYFVINEMDAMRLEQIRQLVPVIIEERRKLKL